MVALLLGVARLLAPARADVMHGLGQRNVLNRSRPISRTSHRVQQHRERQLQGTHAYRSSLGRATDNRRDRHRPHGCSAARLQTFCKRPTVETPRNEAKRLTRSAVFSAFLARVRWVSRNMNLSGRQVLVGFPEPFFRVLRSACGPDPSPLHPEPRERLADAQLRNERAGLHVVHFVAGTRDRDVELTPALGDLLGIGVEPRQTGRPPWLDRARKRRVPAR